MSYHPYRVLTLVLVGVALGACQGMTAGHDDGPAAHTTTGQDFDKQFLDEMSQHHAGAIALAQVAQQKGSIDHVKSMANSLITKQQGELQQLQSWRTQWYGQGPAPAPRDKDRQSAEEVGRLSGVPFDKAWVNKIIAHHQEGIRMATPATHHATHPEVKQFAQKMISDQTHEIEHLQEHLKQW